MRLFVCLFLKGEEEETERMSCVCLDVKLQQLFARHFSEYLWKCGQTLGSNPVVALSINIIPLNNSFLQTAEVQDLKCGSIYFGEEVVNICKRMSGN